jgi:glutathione S-transferase
MIRLYDNELSGNCYKVRLLLALLRLPYERVHVDLHPVYENRSSWFLAVNPLGEVPVLDDSGFVLPGSHAILEYLANRYDASGQWYPRSEPSARAAVSIWLDTATELTSLISAARRHDVLLEVGDVGAQRARAHALLRLVDEQLWFSEQEGTGWLCGGGHPTIADLACFAWIMLSGEGAISRLAYPAINRWADRVKRLAGFTPMSGIFPASPAAAADC